MKIPLFAEILSQLERRIYTSKISLPHWLIAEENSIEPSEKNFLGSWRLGGPNDVRPYVVTESFGGYDKTVWFKNKISIPKEFNGKPVVFVADFAEALLYVNSKPFHGMDLNHQEVLLTNKARRNETFSLDIQAYCGRTKEKASLNTAFIATLNAEARSLFNALSILKNFYDTTAEAGNAATQLTEQLQNVLVPFKGIPPHSLAFDDAIWRAHAVLRRASNPKPSTSRSSYATPSLHLIAHSHIDVVWLWTLKETMRKCARTFSTALRLLDEFPEFTFAQSQALLYEFTKQNYPELYAQIKRRVKEGRWEPVGAMWVEPDCNIPNGESLVRQILYGKKFFKAEFGIDVKEVWLPDTFGYSWALPQIMKKAGIEYFFTTKLTWNDTTRFPHGTFWWKGIDGSRVLAHLPPVGLEGMVEPKHLVKSLREHPERRQSPHVLQTFGYGDGGGGPTKRDVEAARTLSASAHSARLSNVRPFFRSVKRTAQRNESRLPEWNDELYLELHRGTYTTHAWIKKANREAERLLYKTELLCSLAVLAGKKYPGAEIESAWKKLLLNQFHDIVPGTAIADAYVDARQAFEDIAETCSHLKEKALACFVQKPTVKGLRSTSKGRAFTLFNSLSFTRAEYVTLRFRSKAKRFVVLDEDGQLIVSQLISARNGDVELLCFIENILPFSFTQLTVYDEKGIRDAESNTHWRKKRLQTPFYVVEFSTDGTISSLYDKSLKRELIPKGRRANQFQTFRDTPKQWDAWEIDPHYHHQRFNLFKFVRAEVVELGKLRAVIRVQHEARSGSRLSQEIAFYHASKRIDFVTTVDWREERTLLKVAFPMKVKARVATFETQFGSLKRTTKPTTPAEKAKFEVPAQQWADMSDKRFGISLLNDCKYGYDAKGDTLRLTLIRSPHYPHPQEPWWLTDEAITDQGIHTFTYSLYPHEGDWRGGETIKRSRELNNPVIIFAGQLHNSPTPFLATSKSNIVVDSIKKAEESDQLVVRFHEAHGKKTRTRIQFGHAPEQAEETDLLERRIKQLPTHGGRLELQFAPFEIKTLKISY